MPVIFSHVLVDVYTPPVINISMPMLQPVHICANNWKLLTTAPEHHTLWPSSRVVPITPPYTHTIYHQKLYHRTKNITNKPTVICWHIPKFIINVPKNLINSSAIGAKHIFYAACGLILCCLELENHLITGHPLSGIIVIFVITILPSQQKLWCSQARSTFSLPMPQPG